MANGTATKEVPTASQSRFFEPLGDVGPVEIIWSDPTSILALCVVNFLFSKQSKGQCKRTLSPKENRHTDDILCRDFRRASIRIGI